MTPTECQAWIQTGLGKEWPRQGHPKALISPYDQRSVPMLTWARACFEQGSLPSLLALPGEASLLVLPGDGMFQAQRIVNGKCRPVILHGYGGAKKEMPTSLAALAKFGWIPMATAMVESASSPPLWAGNDWRPILGTSVDTRIFYSCSVSGFACPVMTCISGMLPTAGYSLAKSMSHLVLIVMTLLTPFESCLWISGLPHTLLCSLDPRRPTKATQTRQSSTRGHRLRMWFRHRTMNFPHLKKFL